MYWGVVVPAMQCVLVVCARSWGILAALVGLIALISSGTRCAPCFARLLSELGADLSSGIWCSVAPLFHSAQLLAGEGG